VSTPWVDWPSTERDVDSNMDAPFWNKFNDRHKVHRTQSIPPWELDISNSVGRAGVDNQLWVPPWASELLALMFVAINITGQQADDAGTGGAALELERFGKPAVFAGGTFAQVQLACQVIFVRDGPGFVPECAKVLPGADGSPETDSGKFFAKTSLVRIPVEMRGVIVTMHWRFIKSGNTTTTDLRNLQTIGSKRPWFFRG